ncbi:MAG: ABC transporter substrate-binding protein [Porticoccaceae bacterium]|nr:ABC transporter substrate-binding protein [Porticoccaceae bacterium]
MFNYAKFDSAKQKPAKQKSNTQNVLLALVFSLGAVSSQGFAQETEQGAASQLNPVIMEQFQPLFTAITTELGANKARYLTEPAAYYALVDRYLRPRWDTASTASALVGRNYFESLSTAEQSALTAAVDSTLVRYAFEGLEHYSGQRFDIADIVVSDGAAMGWVQVLMESPIIPDINLDVLIKQGDKDDWKAVDIRFKGITYVSIKKHSFREIIAESGLQALIGDLQGKNAAYFKVICAETKTVDLPPCNLKTK